MKKNVLKMKLNEKLQFMENMFKFNLELEI